MKLTGIIWLEEIVEKIERNQHVSQEEVREILIGHSLFSLLRKVIAAEKTFIRQWVRQVATDI